MYVDFPLNSIDIIVTQENEWAAKQTAPVTNENFCRHVIL